MAAQTGGGNRHSGRASVVAETYTFDLAIGVRRDAAVSWSHFSASAVTDSLPMVRERAVIHFRAKLLRPLEFPRRSWGFVVLPKSASAKLPSRGVIAVHVNLNGHAFQANLEPDGKKGHWLKISARMLASAGAAVGERISMDIHPVERVSQPPVPADFHRALSAAVRARVLWADLTPVARRDWIQWIVSAKRAETRARRIRKACAMLAAGKRRVCCFDRSGFYSKGLTAPDVAE